MDLEYWNNFLTPLLGFFPAGIAGWFYEKYQEEELGIRFDKKDILRTAFAGIAGGGVAIFFPYWLLGIILGTVSAVIVILHYKK